MYKNTVKLKKLYFDPLIFGFYLVKNQASKRDIFKLYNRLHPSGQNNGSFLLSDENWMFYTPTGGNEFILWF